MRQWWHIKWVVPASQARRHTLEDEYEREFPDHLIHEDVTLGEIFEEMTGIPTNWST